MILHVGSKQIDNCYLNIRSRNRLIELGFIIYKYSKETTRKRRSETIEIYNKIFNDTYTLLDKFKYITKKTLFTSEDIRNNPDIYKSVMNHLTLLENFAKGLEYEVYDFKTFVYLTPNELFEILNSLKQFNHALLEKLLHVKFHEDGGTAAFGLSVWSKFIAECIANYVMNEKTHNVFFSKTRTIDTSSI